MKARWNSVAIVGVGLIGGSVGQALRARRLAERIVGVGRSAASLEEARRHGAVTETSRDLAAAVATADLVVVTAGVASIPALLEEIDAAVRPGTIITDAGSTKATIVAAWERRRRSRRGRFVGAHPLTGGHRRGPAAADGGMFAGRVAVVTPATRTPPDDVEEVGGFWAALGSTVFVMPPKEHDRILAFTSHAPHLMAAAVAVATPPALGRFTAGGWRDTTRIAAGDPDLWADIILDNAGHVADALRRVAGAVEKMLAAIEAGDRRRLATLLRRAKDVRDAVGS
jgi:prephenate dehydrogenase